MRSLSPNGFLPGIKPTERMPVVPPTILHIPFQTLTPFWPSQSYNMNQQIPHSIAEVDEIIHRGPAPIQILSSFEQRFAQISVAHRQSLHIKKLYGSHPTVERRFDDTRENHRAGASSPNPKYRKGYEGVLSEISQGLGNVLGDGRVRCFLDLGFSPGGFSNWLLTNNPQSSGVGITLPESEAGYVYQPYEQLTQQSRFTPVFADIVTVTQQSLNNGVNPVDSVLSGNGNGRARFDLIIAGAIPTLQGRMRWYQHVQLALSQLYIVLLNLQNNGNAIFVIKTKAFKWQVEMLSILRKCFASVETVKEPMHKTRSSCYVVCKGFKRSNGSESNVAQYVQTLCTVLWTLGEIAAARAEVNPETAMPPLSGYNDDNLFNEEYQFVLRLFEPRWQDQYNAIREEFRKVLEPGMGSTFSNSSFLQICLADSRPCHAGTSRDAPNSNWRSRNTQVGQGTMRTTGSFDFGTSARGSSSQSWRRGA